MANETRVGIIGCGNITSTIHLPILMNMPGVKVAYIADVQSPDTVAGDFGTRAIRIRQGSELPDCDLAFLATPVGARHDYIEEMGKRDVFVFTEKPFAMHGEQHKAYLDLAKNITCNYMRTTFGSTGQIREMVSAKLFGSLQRVDITEGGIVGATGKSRTHYQTDVSLSGGGILMERGCHSLSQLAYILDGFSFEVSEAKIKWLDRLDVDVETTIKGLGDNTVDISYHVSQIRPVANCARFSFESAIVEFDHTNPASGLRLTSLDGNNEYHVHGDSSMASTIIQSFFLRWNSVVSACAGQISIDSAAETSINATKLIDAIYLAGGRAAR